MDFEYLVSVIIPVYNCEDFLGVAIDSALEQSYKKTEIIVVDDGSQDDSLSIATKYSGIRCVQIAHQGISQARNIGIQESKGDYIAFLDADDVWLKDKLKIQIDLLKKNPELWYILAKMENFCDNDNEAVCWLEKTEFDQNPIGIQTLLARKEIFNIVGLFDTHLSIGEDMDWLVRAKEKHIPMHIMDQVLVKRRIHNSNTCRLLYRDRRKITIEILHRSIKRQRSNG